MSGALVAELVLTMNSPEEPLLELNSEEARATLRGRTLIERGSDNAPPVAEEIRSCCTSRTSLVVEAESANSDATRGCSGVAPGTTVNGLRPNLLADFASLLRMTAAVRFDVGEGQGEGLVVGMFSAVPWVISARLR